MSVICVGRIPVDPRLAECLEKGKSYVEIYAGVPAQKAMADIVQKVLSATGTGPKSTENDT